MPLLIKNSQKNSITLTYISNVSQAGVNGMIIKEWKPPCKKRYKLLSLSKKDKKSKIQDYSPAA